MSRLSIEVTPEFHAAIKAMAFEQGVSLRDFVVGNLADNMHYNTHQELEDCSLCAQYGGKNKKLKKRSKKDMQIVGSYETTEEMFAALGIEL